MEFFDLAPIEHYLTGTLVVRAVVRGNCKPASGVKLQVEAGPAADCGPG